MKHHSIWQVMSLRTWGVCTCWEYGCVMLFLVFASKLSPQSPAEQLLHASLLSNWKNVFNIFKFTLLSTVINNKLLTAPVEGVTRIQYYLHTFYAQCFWTQIQTFLVTIWLGNCSSQPWAVNHDRETFLYHAQPLDFSISSIPAFSQPAFNFYI